MNFLQIILIWKHTEITLISSVIKASDSFLMYWISNNLPYILFPSLLSFFCFFIYFSGKIPDKTTEVWFTRESVTQWGRNARGSMTRWIGNLSPFIQLESRKGKMMLLRSLSHFISLWLSLEPRSKDDTVHIQGRFTLSSWISVKTTSQTNPEVLTPFRWF